MCNAGNRRHHTQKESDRIARGKKNKNEKLISKSLCLPWKMRETKKVPTGNEASHPVRVKHVATTCATPPEAINAKQSPKRQKKKKKGRRGKDTHIHTKYLVTSNQSMCIRAKVNKTPHIPASVWDMDDPMNRGATDGSSQTPSIVQSQNWGRLTPLDRHLHNGRRSKTSSITLVHLEAVTEHLLPFLPLKEQLTISPSPKRYKEWMNITFNVPTDKEKNACTHTNRYI